MPAASSGRQRRARTKSNPELDRVYAESCAAHERFIQEGKQLDIAFLKDMRSIAPTVVDGVLYFPLPGATEKSELGKWIDNKLAKELATLGEFNGDQPSENEAEEVDSAAPANP
jgi:hypothetical protein